MRALFRLSRRLKFGPVSFTAALVLFLGLLLFSTMRVEVPSQQRHASGLSTARGIASVMPAMEWMSFSSGENKPLAGLQDVELDCSVQSERPPFVSRSPFIRIVLKGCDARKVTNTRNLFEATLFQFGEKHSSSDYISLAPGVNEISMETESGGETSYLKLVILYQ